MTTKVLNIKIEDIEDTSPEKSPKILDMLNNISDDNLTITSSKQFHV